LKIGQIVADLKIDGKAPSNMDLLIIAVNGSIRTP